MNILVSLRYLPKSTIETDIFKGVYVNSLALQAVVDRWTTMSNEAAQANNKPGSATGSGSYNVLMELYRVNEPFIQEVVDASRKILTTVLEDLVPGDHLKHAPVRTCFRLLSGMIFILKVSAEVLNYVYLSLTNLVRPSRWAPKKMMCAYPLIFKIAPSKHYERALLMTST